MLLLLHSGLADEFLVGKPLADDLRDYKAETVAVIQFFPVVVPKRLLIKVTEKMERFNAHVGSVKSALQETPKVFKSVRVDNTIDVSDRVIDDLVRVLAFQSVVGFQIIAVERRSRLDMLPHFGLKRFLLSVVHYHRADFSAAFHNSHDGNLVLGSRSGDAPLPLRDMHVAGLPADEGLVNLDFARKLFQERASLHSLPNPVHHKPCCLLRHAKSAGDFIGTDSVLVICNRPCGSKPLVQAERRILKDSPDLDGELPVMVDALALPLALIGKKTDIGTSASRTDYASGPSASHKISKAAVGVAEIDNRLLQRLWFGLLCVAHGYKSTSDGLICQVYSYPRKEKVTTTSNILKLLDRAGELGSSTFQTGMSKRAGRGGRRTLPYAFTEQGVAMVSSVLRSRRAIQVNIVIMRAFVKFRELPFAHVDLARKLDELERKYERHDSRLRQCLRPSGS